MQTHLTCKSIIHNKIHDLIYLVTWIFPNIIGLIIVLREKFTTCGCVSLCVYVFLSHCVGNLSQLHNKNSSHGDSPQARLKFIYFSQYFKFNLRIWIRGLEMLFYITYFTCHNSNFIYVYRYMLSQLINNYLLVEI